MDWNLKLKIGLFLFSKGNEISDFTVEQFEECKRFGLERFEQGKAFIEKLIADFAGSTMAMDDESLRMACLDAISDSDVDAEARAKEIGLHLDVDEIKFLQEIVKACIDDPQSVRDAIASYEPVAQAGATVCGIPDDFSQGASVASANVGWHMADREKWEKVWEMSEGGAGGLIVTVDTGTRPDHPDIPEQVAPPASVVPGEPSGIDNNGHGTHCQGTNTGQNGIGVAPKALAWSVQCLSARGSGQTNWTAQAIHLAIDKAIEIKATYLVVSVSIGGGGPDAATTAALLRASKLHETHGIPAIVVAAAGNDGYQGRDTVNNPARDRNACAVSAYAETGLIAGFSSGGPDVDVAAPGQDIISASHRGGRVSNSGTSMATPFMAGTAGLVQAFLLKNGFSMLHNTTSFIAFIEKYATDAGSPGEDNSFGAGILETFEVLLDRRPDDVKMLATSARKAGKLATMMLMFFGLLACGDCQNANAQEELEIRTVVKTVEIVTTFIGDKQVGAPVTREVGEPKETIKPVSAFQFDESSTTIVSIGSDLVLRRRVAIAPGKFVIEQPGDHILFADPMPPTKRITIKEPEPKFDLSAIAPLTKSLADQLNDKPTKEKLATVYADAASKIASMNLGEAGQFVKVAVLEVWPTREGSSRLVDWVNGFQRPLQAEFNRIGFSDTKTYIKALEEIVKGLTQ